MAGKLTEEQRAEIVRRYEEGETQSEIASNFSVSQSGVSYILRSEGVKSRTRAEQKLPRKITLSREDLHRLYWLEGKTTTEIARLIGVSHPSICQRMELEGIARRPNGYLRPPETAVVHAYEVQQQSPSDIAREKGVSCSTVLNWLKRYGIEKREGPQHRKCTEVNAAALRSLYWSEQKSLSEIARLAGCSLGTVRRWALAYEMPLRSASEQQVLNNRAPRTERQTAQARAMQKLGAAASAAHRRENPELARELARHAGRKKTALHRVRFCAWCGQTLSAEHAQRLPPGQACCNHSHAGSLFQHRRHHPQEARPILLDRLRDESPLWCKRPELEQIAARFGADEREINALLAERRKPRAVKVEQIGAVGEALLRAAREAR